MLILENDLNNLFFFQISKRIETIVYNLLVKNNDQQIYSHLFEDVDKSHEYSYKTTLFTEKLIKILLSRVPMKFLEDNVIKNSIKYKTIKSIDILSSRKDMYFNTNKIFKCPDFVLNHYIFNEEIREILKDNSKLKLDEPDQILFKELKNNFIEIKKEYYESKKQNCDKDIIELLNKYQVEILKNDKLILERRQDFDKNKRMTLFRKQLVLYKCGVLDTIIDL